LFVQTPPTADEAGHCNHVRVDEIGDTPVVVFKQGECGITGESTAIVILWRICVSLSVFFMVVANKHNALIFMFIYFISL